MDRLWHCNRRSSRSGLAFEPLSDTVPTMYLYSTQLNIPDTHNCQKGTGFLMRMRDTTSKRSQMTTITISSHSSKSD